MQLKAPSTIRRRDAFNQRAPPRSGCRATRIFKINGQRTEWHCLSSCNAFQAARIGRPRSVVSPPDPNSWPLNIPSSYSVPTVSAVLLVVAQQCVPFATYRRVSPYVACTNCRCIAKQGGKSAGSCNRLLAAPRDSTAERSGTAQTRGNSPVFEARNPSSRCSLLESPRPSPGRTSWSGKSKNCCCSPAWAGSSRASPTP